MKRLHRHCLLPLSWLLTVMLPLKQQVKVANPAVELGWSWVDTSGFPLVFRYPDPYLPFTYTYLLAPLLLNWAVIYVLSRGLASLGARGWAGHLALPRHTVELLLFLLWLVALCSGFWHWVLAMLGHWHWLDGGQGLEPR